MAYPEALWALIRADYEAGIETVKFIAAFHGVADRTIHRRVVMEGWPRRSDRRIRARSRKAEPEQDAQEAVAPPPVAAPSRPPEPVRPLPPAKKVSEKVMIARLYRAIDEKLKNLEARMGSDKDLSTAESERETRELGVMIRSFEKVTECATEIENRRRAKAPERSGEADAERMRREIAERLERLTSQGNAGGRSQKPE